MANRLPLVLSPNGRLSELPTGDFVAQALWTKLSTATASSSASVAFTLPAGFNAYKIVFSNVAPATDGAFIWLRTSANGGISYDSGASDYQWVSDRTNTAGTFTGGGSGADTKIALQVNVGVGNAANESASGEIDIILPSAAQFCKVWFALTSLDTGTSIVPAWGGGFRASAASVNAVQLLFSTGNIASGQFDLYGMAA